MFISAKLPGQRAKLAANHLYKQFPEVKTAFIAAWIIASIIVFFLVLLPGLLYSDILIYISNVMQTAHQEPCALCGMTEAFIAISQGNFAQAKDLNPWSIKLHAIILINEVLAILVLVYILKEFLRAKYLS